MLLFPIVISSIEDNSDREFMENLYRNHYNMMYRVVYRYAQNTYDADDIISEACLVLIDKIPFLKTLPPNERAAYINAITRNTGRNFCQSRYKRHEIPSDGEFLEREKSLDHEPDVAILEEITVLDIQSALNELGEADCDLLTMKYIAEMSDTDIAKALGISHGSLRTRLSRARRRMYEIYISKNK